MLLNGLDLSILRIGKVDPIHTIWQFQQREMNSSKYCKIGVGSAKFDYNSAGITIF